MWHPNLQRAGDCVRLVIRHPRRNPLLEPIDAEEQHVDLDEAELRVDTLILAGTGGEIDAIKSNDRPLEWWMRVPGFTPV